MFLELADPDPPATDGEPSEPGVVRGLAPAALPQSKLNNRVLENAGPNEPIFVLRAQDVLAPATVRHWAILAARHGVSAEKVADAIAIAAVMEAWPHKKTPD